MKFKSLLIATILVAAGSVCSVSSFAQKQGREGKAQMEEKIRQEKTAFLTTELSITSEESESFWAVYNEVDQKRVAAMKDVRKATFALQKALKEGKSELKGELDAYEKAIKGREAANQQALRAFRKAFGEEKTAKLVVAEEKFTKFQLFKLNGRGHGAHGGPQQRQQRQQSGAGTQIAE